MAEENEEAAIQAHIKDQLRQFRILRQWNQETMARHVGTSKAKYQKYENPNEKRNVPIVVLRNFCELAGITVDEAIALKRGRRPA